MLYHKAVYFNPNLITDLSVRAQILESHKRDYMLMTGSLATVQTMISYFVVRSYIFPQSRLLNFGCVSVTSGAILYLTGKNTEF